MDTDTVLFIYCIDRLVDMFVGVRSACIVHGFVNVGLHINANNNVQQNLHHTEVLVRG